MNQRNIHNPDERPPVCFRHGFSLIELIGVLSVVAFLGLMLAQTVIRRSDFAAVTTEQARMSVLTNALTFQILLSNNIPSQGNWTAAMANWVPYSTDDIANNARHNTRAYLIDTSGWLSSGGYTQTGTGSGSAPINARVMFVSSIGLSLPANLLSGTPLTSTDFNALWNSTAGTVPTTGVWSGWTGKGVDVLVQRVNLQPLFYQLVLVNRDASASARYVVNGTTSIAVANGTPVNTFYLGGTAITLMAGAVAQTKYLVGQNTSFSFENGVWGGQIAYDAINDVNSASIPGTSFDTAAKAFYAAVTNPGIANGTSLGGDQTSVLGSFTDLMTIYTSWANDGFPTYGNGDAGNHLPIWNLLQKAGASGGYVQTYAGSNNSGLLSP